MYSNRITTEQTPVVYCHKPRLLSLTAYIHTSQYISEQIN